MKFPLTFHLKIDEIPITFSLKIDEILAWAGPEQFLGIPFTF